MDTNRRPTQVNRIAAYLTQYGSITALEALRDLGVMNLKGRIFEMRSDGYAIKTTWETVKNRWGEDSKIARYVLEVKP